MAAKIDIKKQNKHLFASKRELHLVEVPKFRCWMINCILGPQCSNKWSRRR